MLPTSSGRTSAREIESTAPTHNSTSDSDPLPQQIAPICEPDRHETIQMAPPHLSSLLLVALHPTLARNP